LQEVHNKVLRQHDPQCVAASKALQAERMTQANWPAASQEALRTMMHLSQAQQYVTKATAELNNMKQRADKVNKKALELERAVNVEWGGLQGCTLLQPRSRSQGQEVTSPSG